MARRADPNRRSGRRGRLAATVLLALGLAACGGRGGRDYTVRGRVAQLPQAGQPASAFMIAHEPVDDFVDRDGKVSGMDSMTMSFPLARGVTPAGLAVGDPIRFTLHVDWAAERPVEITRLEKLPPGTPIVFRAARPGR